MSDEGPDPFDGPATDRGVPSRSRSRSSDVLAATGLVAGSSALVAFVGYWSAGPDTTELWFTLTLAGMAGGAVLGLAALLLARRTGAPSGRALADVALASVPLVLVLLFYAATWGTMAVESLLYRLLGGG